MPPPEQTLAEARIPPDMLALIRQLMPLLLSGQHPAASALRKQYECARVTRMELTGAGFAADFDVDDQAPLADPGEITGGSVAIDLDGLRLGAGCVLFVRGGKLRTLEGYTFEEPWPERLLVRRLYDVSPIVAALPPPRHSA